jgi:hypothetical protein
MMVTETASMFMLLSTLATIALTVAGIGASVLWFISVLRKHGLRVKFAAA